MRKKFFLFILMLLTGNISLLAYTNLTPDEVHQKLVNGDTLLLLDVREISEYNAGHIAEPEGQLPITPVSMPLNSQVLSNQHTRLPSDIDIVVYCRSGGRSATASAFLESQGFTRIFNMTSGFSGWPYESRTGGFGDHSGIWIGFQAEDPRVLSCADTENPSQIIFPSGAVPAVDDSFYVELHEASDQITIPNAALHSDPEGLYYVTFLNRFGLSMFDGDSLILNNNAELKFYTMPVEGNLQNPDMRTWIPGKGWKSLVFTFQGSAFQREEQVLRRWYYVGGQPVTAVEEWSGPQPVITVHVFPNPFNHSVTIQTSQTAHISIFDIRGRLISHLTATKWVPESDLVSGVYFVHVQYGNQHITRKIVYMK